MSIENSDHTVPTYQELEKKVADLEAENGDLKLRLFNLQQAYSNLRHQYHAQLMADHTIGEFVNNLNCHIHMEDTNNVTVN